MDAQNEYPFPQSSEIFYHPLPPEYATPQVWELHDVVQKPDEGARNAILQGLSEQTIPELPPTVNFETMNPSLVTQKNEPGRYVIGKKFGSGRSGGVYRAFDRKLGKEVAIKFIDTQSEYSNNKTLELEAKTIGQAEHPSVVTVYKYFITDEYIPHKTRGREQGKTGVMVMELVEGGENLRMMLNRKKLTPEKAATYTMQLAQGIDFMAKKDIIHRDLKPSNILVTDDFAKIADFGIATTVVPKTLVMGSPLYMNPEAMDSVRPALPSLSGEIFSLALISFHMLTQKNAYLAFLDLDTDDTDAVNEVLFTMGTGPGYGGWDGIAQKLQIRLQTALRGTDADVTQVIAVFDKALKIDPTKRYTTATEFATELQKALLPRPK